MKKVITGVRLFESSGQGRRGYRNNFFSCGEHRVDGVANTSFWRIWRQIGSEWRKLWRQTPHRLFHFKLDLTISLLYFWRLRGKPTVVTLNHFGLYLTICRHAKAFKVTLNHFTWRYCLVYWFLCMISKMGVKLII